MVLVYFVFTFISVFSCVLRTIFMLNKCQGTSTSGQLWAMRRHQTMAVCCRQPMLILYKPFSSCHQTCHQKTAGSWQTIFPWKPRTWNDPLMMQGWWSWTALNPWPTCHPLCCQTWPSPSVKDRRWWRSGFRQLLGLHCMAFQRLNTPRL